MTCSAKPGSRYNEKNVNGGGNMKRESTYLVDWQFALGDAEPDWTETRTVTIPHTWNIEDGTKETWGIGWYRCILPAQNIQGKRIFVSFRSVYHDAVIFFKWHAGRHSLCLRIHSIHCRIDRRMEQHRGQRIGRTGRQPLCLQYIAIPT